MRKTFVFILGVLVALTLLLSPAAGTVLLGRAARSLADFNGDRTADLVVGIPDEDQPPADGMGAFQVLYGSAVDGLWGGTNDVWGQFANPAESGDTFAHSLAVGDFDGDGHADLAVGIPWEDLEGTSTIPNAGAVEVWYGDDFGLDPDSAEFWHQDVGNVGSIAEEGDLFGYALAAGDFDGDGWDDLAVGVPYETWVEDNCGIVQILYGSDDGLTDVGTQLFRQGAGGISEPEESGDRFGMTLTAGNFDGDNYDDLAIAAPYENRENPSALTDYGVAHILYGSGGGLTTSGWQMWSLSSPDDYDYFGQALTSGDFDGNGYADLAVGVPGRDLVGPVLDGGAVFVLFGTDDGLSAAGSETWQQGNPEHFDMFGSALSAGDYNGDGHDDLAIGAPEEDMGDVVDAGALEVLYGATGGLVRRVSNDYWHQDRTGMEDTCQTNDNFGYALASGDFDGDGYTDLVAGIPYEGINDPDDEAGAAQVMYGSPAGISASGSWFFHQGLPEIEGLAEPDDHFGMSLVAIPRAVGRVYMPVVLRNAH